MVEQSAVPSLSHILPGTWSLSKCRCHNALKWMDTQPICPRFLISQECAFQISWTWPFSSVTTIFLHLVSLEEGKCYTLGLFLWVDISLAVGPMSYSPNENTKALTKRLLAAPPCSLISVPLKAGLISGPANDPRHWHWLERYRMRFQNCL